MALEIESNKTAKIQIAQAHPGSVQLREDKNDHGHPDFISSLCLWLKLDSWIYIMIVYGTERRKSYA